MKIEKKSGWINIYSEEFSYCKYVRYTSGYETGYREVDRMIHETEHLAKEFVDNDPSVIQVYIEWEE